MITLLKVVVLIVIMLLIAYPVIPLPKPLQHFSFNYRLRYKNPDNKKNFFFILLTLALYLAIYLLLDLLSELTSFVFTIPILSTLISMLLNSLNSHVHFVFFAINIVIANVILLYTYFLVKGLLKKGIIDRVFKINKKKNSKTDDGKNDTSNDKSTDKDEDGDKKDDKSDDRIPQFDHSDDNKIIDTEEEDQQLTKKKKRFWLFRLFSKKNKKNSNRKIKNDQNNSITPNKDRDANGDLTLYGLIRMLLFKPFFEGDNYEYARGWVARARKVLQYFIYLVLALYGVFFTCVFVSVLFPIPLSVYNVLINTLHIESWYIYPFISLLFLQEICNFFDSPVLPKNIAKNKADEKKLEDTEEKESDLKALQREIYNRFDKEHYLHYYCEKKNEKAKEYTCTNIEFASALEYIKKEMQLLTGNVVQSYMECLDKIYNKNHVYFATSFYSELGEYLTAYTYIRLLSGARMLFVVSEPSERNTLKKHLSERLMQMTDSSPTATWRIRTAEERLDQADILIASPSDFRDDNITEQFPGFFDEVCNAIFVDADKMVALDSYLCLIMSTRLQRATKGRIRFLFLTFDLLKGFASATIPKFFNVEDVITLSCANENDEVSYTLWNRESKKNRIYNKNGQSLTSIESIIADLACQYGVDGVRLITESPLDSADTKNFTDHGIEINKLYRPVPDTSYMIYSDDRCNLSSAIYACTRFRGKKNSFVHIISKPYLLREYFMTKAAYEKYITRSSFIKPRVTEHAERHKLSLLRIFCDATCDMGITLSSFEARVKKVILDCVERNDVISSQYCRNIIERCNINELKSKDLAAYLIAGLYDDVSCPPAASTAQRAKEFYIIINPNQHSGYELTEEKYIRFNKAKSVFDKLFECNRRVELFINDENIGKLDTFPARAHLEYIAGQSIIYQNTEYEIEHIAEDGSALFLRRKNAKVKNCLDTVHLRRYSISSLTQQGQTGVLHNTRSPLAEIRVALNNAELTAETYGFYSLMTDRQTLDFYRGAEGNPHVEKPHVRQYKQCKVMTVTLVSRNECNDKMRLLISAVANEFIKTLFPAAYRCLSIVPILSEPIPFDAENEPESEIDRIRTLYPYLQSPSEEFVEKDGNVMRFLFINDCTEDMGIIDWFYDKSALYMQEFLANINAYIHWLNKHLDKQHFIYFGGEAIPECYDLQSCCDLLKDLNWTMSDSGDKDYDTAGEEEEIEENRRCSFCHLKMESGRYLKFDRNRYICADCFDTVDSQKILDELLQDAIKYLTQTYPEISFPTAKTALDSVYQLLPGQELSEFYYRLDDDTRTVFVERDDPETNATVSLIRGIISLWQLDSGFRISYSNAQLYYEELKYLRSIGKNESADWIYEALDEQTKEGVNEIMTYLGEKNDTGDGNEDPADDTDTTDKKDDNVTPEPNAPENDSSESANTLTSFTFMREKANELDDDYDFSDGEEDGSEQLYPPNEVPRFWKRYLKNQRIDNDKEEDIPQDNEEIPSENDTQENDTSPADDTVQDETDKTDDSTGDDKNAVEDKKTQKDKKKKNGFFSRLFKKRSVIPKEPEEETNPKIRFYNDLVRAYYSYSEEPISRAGLSDSDVTTIWTYVRSDYPEVFWVAYTWNWDSNNFYPIYRCKDAYGRFDKKQVERKRAELKKAAKPFTKGITKRTDPYEAFLTIYRRLILTLDYDGRGLDAGIDADMKRDDPLRSLYSALVEHKVVCAGYAAALQYLLQSVGIVSGYVISEINNAQGDCHAFNMVKIGKFVYYVDPTWGDYSNTKTGNKYQNSVFYTYCCVPYKEFILTGDANSQMYHIPRKNYYPHVKEMAYTNHEYCRFHGTYLTRYNKAQISQALANAAIEYSEKEMGVFTVPFRCVNVTEAKSMYSQLWNKDLDEVIENACEIASKNRKALKILKRKSWTVFDNTTNCTFHICVGDK